MHLQRYVINGRRFHFGRHGLGQEETAITMSSDSLFSAIVARLAENFPSAHLDEFLEPFLSETPDPPFVLTSTFPYLHGHALFPVVAGSPQTDNPRSAEEGVDQKKLKKIRFVSERGFREMLKGHLTADLVLNVHAVASKTAGSARGVPESVRAQIARSCVNRHLAQEGSVLLHPLDLKCSLDQDGTVVMRSIGENGDTFPEGPYWSKSDHPHVTLDRVSNGPALFFTGEVAFQPHCGLWFGVWWRKPENPWKMLFETAIADLNYAGLGGDRNNGYGTCEIRPVDELELPDAGSKSYWTNLSRYLPQATEMEGLLDEHAVYSLESVGGWLGSGTSAGQRRRTLTMIPEGAMLGRVASEVPGHMPDVRPVYQAQPPGFEHHPVYRAGFAVPVGIGAK